MYNRNTKTKRELNTIFNDGNSDILYESFKVVIFESLKTIMYNKEACAEGESIQEESCVNST